MATDLHYHIQNTPLCDTHEHLSLEDEWVQNGPDILQDLFGNYVPADLVVAGASQEVVDKLQDGSDPDIKGRFMGIQKAWEATQHTGYGEAVRLIAEHIYGLSEITPAGLEQAQSKLVQLRRPGERLRLLRDVGKLDHVQIDNFNWPCPPDASGPDFFLYDISWRGFCNGDLKLEELAEETGVTVENIRDLDEAMAAIFEKYSSYAIAVKAQHAYNRTLLWSERSDEEAASVLEKVLKGSELLEEDRLCLGDWCWARGVELAIQHNLPFKLHTGYYAGYGRMPIDRIKGGNLCGILAQYPEARFVLMHIAYPYNDELVALAKHYPNVYADICWTWAINPYASYDFVRKFIHAVPSNKLFAFGGDTVWPTSSVAYAVQARKWLTRALEAEVSEGDLTEKQAMYLATRFMRSNQMDCFDLEGTKAALRAA